MSRWFWNRCLRSSFLEYLRSFRFWESVGIFGDKKRPPRRAVPKEGKERSNVCMKNNITPLTKTQEEQELKVFLDLGTGIDNREEYEKEIPSDE